MAGPSGQTTRLHLPKPGPDDNVDVPRDIGALADALDLRLPGGALGAVLNGTPVATVGAVGQVRAGRQLTVQDFTNMGLSAPIGLWNLSDLTDASGNNRNLTNKGAVPFAPGINGLAATAAQFTGSTGQVLYLPDTGAADPFRRSTGTFGCWIRSAKQNTNFTVFGKGLTASGSFGWQIYVNANVAVVQGSVDGTNVVAVGGGTGITDDRWHFLTMVHDGSYIKLYVDAALDAAAVFGLGFTPVAPFNIGGLAGDAANAVNGPFWGRIDEMFITADILNEDQIRNLYCAKIAHTYGAVPTRFNLGVRRRRRGATLVPADFSTPPLRLHNFTNSTTAQVFADEGSQNVPLVDVGAGAGMTAVAGADGLNSNAIAFSSGHHLASSDATLPAGLAARSFGCWVKTTQNQANINLVTWGGGGAVLWIFNGYFQSQSIGDTMGGAALAIDGQWHHAVVVEDNAAADGIRRKLYTDGRLTGVSTVLNSLVSGGANAFRIGAGAAGASPLTGAIDGAFVCGYALTVEEVLRIYTKTGPVVLPSSPKNVGDHIEAADAGFIYAIFDSLEPQFQVDLGAAL